MHPPPHLVVKNVHMLHKINALFLEFIVVYVLAMSYKQTTKKQQRDQFFR